MQNIPIKKAEVKEGKEHKLASRLLVGISAIAELHLEKDRHNVVYHLEGQETQNVIHFQRLDIGGGMTELLFMHFLTTCTDPAKIREITCDAISNPYTIRIREYKTPEFTGILSAELLLKDVDGDMIIFDFSALNKELTSEEKERGMSDGMLFARFSDPSLHLRIGHDDVWKAFLARLSNLALQLKGGIDLAEEQENKSIHDRKTTIYHKSPAGMWQWPDLRYKPQITAQNAQFGTKVAVVPTMTFAATIGICTLVCRKKRRRSG